MVAIKAHADQKERPPIRVKFRIRTVEESAALLAVPAGPQCRCRG